MSYREEFMYFYLLNLNNQPKNALLSPFLILTIHTGFQNLRVASQFQFAKSSLISELFFFFFEPTVVKRTKMKYGNSSHTHKLLITYSICHVMQHF